MKHKILLTGAAGNIGRYLTNYLGEKYDLVLTDIHKPEELPEQHPFLLGDVSDLAFVRQACRGVRTVVHLGADSSPHAQWETLLPANVMGVYNVFQAAHEAGCRRVVFASSIHAVLGYPEDKQIQEYDHLRPKNLYGASKAWGEILGRYYSDQMGLSCICLRLGWVLERDDDLVNPDNKGLYSVMTYEDMAQLFQRSIEAPDHLRYGVFHGVSDNRWKKMAIKKTRERLGYDPVDDSYELAENNWKQAQQESK